MDDEYGQSDISLVVPVIIGKGFVQILNFKLTKDEQAAFNESVDVIVKVF